VSDTIQAAALKEGLERLAFDVRGASFAGLVFGQPKPNPDIVFLHATGFNARAYRTLLAPLGERFRVLALDLRGHGRTTAPARGYNSWNVHREDVIAILENFSAPVALAGHSMGATVSLLAAARRPDLVSALALLEPVLLSDAAYAMHRLPLAPWLQSRFHPLSKAARRRRARFPSHKAALEALTGRGVFKSFTPEALADYVADGFREDGDSGFTLSCAPRYEAATFSAQRHNPWTALRTVTDPIVLLRAERRSTMSEAALRRFRAMRPQARVAVVEGAGHMLPMDRPDRARAAIESAALMGRAGRKFCDDESFT
jgi:pimeloyl-ACP methyl ester carboxylesterase